MDMFAKPERSPQISMTIDGFILASPSFKARYEREGWTGLDFRPLSNGYFDTYPIRVVKLLHLDLFRYDNGGMWEQWDNPEVKKMVVIEHTNSCGSCGTYVCCLGGGARVIVKGEIPVADNEFVVSDIAMGSRDFVNQSVIAGDAIRQSHRAKKFAKTSMAPIVTYESWDNPQPRKAKI